ncbi:MAG: hypothetical protein ACFFDT_34840 [Candidatus Hodarchaeota archaeon]
MSAFCPDCGTEMIPHRGTGYWDCTKEGCSVWAIKRDNQGRIVKIVRVSLPKSLSSETK